VVAKILGEKTMGTLNRGRKKKSSNRHRYEPAKKVKRRLTKKKRGYNWGRSKGSEEGRTTGELGRRENAQAGKKKKQKS